jgi:hypothetical protein
MVQRAPMNTSFLGMSAMRVDLHVNSNLTILDVWFNPSEIVCSMRAGVTK